ncbi:MAG TPA: hypothetical protein VNQ79_13015 [Blastocatellia bacterium]|nr:hypothetical protein [Blastocatellia bacterium]
MNQCNVHLAKPSTWSPLRNELGTGCQPSASRAASSSPASG